MTPRPGRQPYKPGNRAGKPQPDRVMALPGGGHTNGAGERGEGDRAGVPRHNHRGGMNQTANFDPLIRKMARRMARSLPTSDTADDLAQVGRLAVERAIPDWDGRRLAMPTFVQIVASRRMAVFARVERRRGLVRVGDLAPGQCKAVWVRRAATNSAALNNDGCTVNFDGDTSA